MNKKAHAFVIAVFAVIATVMMLASAYPLIALKVIAVFIISMLTVFMYYVMYQVYIGATNAKGN